MEKADVLVHGYRPEELDLPGYSEKTRLEITPNLLEVKLDAYGWTGPWATRRGFDSLVQMSCGIARAGMSWAKQDQPTPLPVQALNHATGYLMAAAVIRAISSAINGNGLRNARLSLARTAELLMMHLQTGTGKLATQITPEDFSDAIENTPWGQAKRLKPAISIKGTPMQWSCPACKLGTSLPGWLC